jgi:membrane-anchored protein YejM (alkaline phosphatase superfamily)
MRKPSDEESAGSEELNQKSGEGDSFPGFSRRIFRYFFCLYFVILVEYSILFAKKMSISGIGSFLFVASSIVAYTYIYILPGTLLSISAAFIIKRVRIRSKFKHWLLNLALIISGSATILFIFLDYKVFSMFRFHINSFVLNLAFTPGGLSSMGASTTDTVVITGAILLVGVFCSGLLFLSEWSRRKIQLPLKKKSIIYSTFFVMVIFLFLFQMTSFAYYFYKSDSSILQNSRNIPLFQPITMKSIFRDVFHISPGAPIKTLQQMDHNSILNYPIKPIRQVQRKKRYNLVFLVAESWRWDTITSEIMPSTLKFAKNEIYFHNHYSSGNGTRMALFGMFYGLYGSYWPTFLDLQRSPIFIDALKQQGYQFDMHTSAKFTYPEFDKTIFSGIAPENMFQSDGRGGFINDRENITNIFKFIKNRDKSRPFMSFMFFESPHAPYTFPDDCIVRKDYLPTFNYSTVDVAANIEKIRNRYLNSVHHLDTQLARVYKFLKEENLMDSTIVVVTGDHGEEFMEKGHWGHNESFHTEQTRPPLIMHIPGIKHKDIQYLTSHLDIIPTLAPYFGITNPPEDYSLGYNMLGNKRRPFTVISSWNRICYMDKNIKYVTSARNQTILIPDEVYFSNDAKLTVQERRKTDISDVMSMVKGMVKFYK